MLAEIRALQSALGIDGPVLLLMAREAAGDSRLRCVADLNSAGQRDLLRYLADLNAYRLPTAA